MDSTKQDFFDKAVKEWAEADRECIRLHSLWNQANARARRLARIKNAAWRELMEPAHDPA